MSEKESLTAEEKAAQIFEANQVPDDDLTDMDEFNILENRGIEYLLKAEGKEDIKLYIKPLKVFEYRKLLEIDELTKNGSTSGEIIDLTLKYFSDFFKIPADDLNMYLEKDDIERISALLGYAIYTGRKMFSKKKVSLKEAANILSLAGKLPSLG